MLFDRNEDFQDEQTTMGSYSIESLLMLDPVQFENLILALLIKMGLKASTTKISGDGGIDVIATNEQPITGGKYIVQCKRYAPGNKVGEPAIRDLLGAVMHENANKGILITTSDFSRQAWSFSRNKTLELLNGDFILKLLNKHLSDFPTKGIPRYRDSEDERYEVENEILCSKFIFSDLTVRDTETSLEWSRNANLSVLPMKWGKLKPVATSQGTIEDEKVYLIDDFIKANLNDVSFAGYSDWRLPTFEELNSLCSRKVKGIWLSGKNMATRLNDIGFINMQEGRYWTATSPARGYYDTIDFAFYEMSHSDFYSEERYVWPVRSGDPLEQTEQNANDSIIYLPN